MSNSRNYQEINMESLVAFANHPFKQYDGQRREDMVASVRENGVITPIIVRPIDGNKYEILSGHNRTAAAREIGLKSVPAIIREGLTDDEAMFIVTETNLIQRSFADMSHSERAVVITVHYDSIKKKSGYRSDLLEGIDSSTLVPVEPRSATKDKLGEQYSLSPSTIFRYLRVNKLITPLKARLDDGRIALRVAVALSYLREYEQEFVENQLEEGNKINIKIAYTLRDESSLAELSEMAVKRLFEPSFYGAEKIKSVKFSGEFLSHYFKKNESPELIESIVGEALSKYFADKM